MAGRDNILGSPMFGGGSLGKSMFPKFSGPNRRKKARLSTDELNELGLDAPGLKDADLPNADTRSAFTKVLDTWDIPRNAVFNAISWLGGVPTHKLRKGALGMKVVTGSDVLRHLGVTNKAVLGVGGLAADIFGDPLTYLGLGHRTGLKISKYVPKFLKSGQRLMKTAFSSAMEGIKESPEITKVAKALGMSESRFLKWSEAALRRHGTKKAALSQMVGRKSGRAYRRLASSAFVPERADAARKLLTEFGEKGWTIFRLPFAASGITAPIGKRKRLWETMAGIRPDETLNFLRSKAPVIRSLTDKVAKTGQLLNNIERTQAAAKAGAVEAKAGYRQLLKGRYAVMKAGIAIQPPVKEIPVATAAVRKAQRAVDVAEAALARVAELKKSKAASTSTVTDLAKKWGKTPSELRGKFPSVMGKIEENAAAAKARIPAPGHVKKLKAGLAEAKTELAAATKAAPKRKLFATEVEAARVRKILSGQNVAASKTLPKADTAQALAESKALLETEKGLAKAATLSPDASLPFRLKAESEIGKSYLEHLGPNATWLQKLKRDLGRTMQEKFGMGATDASRRMAGIRQRIGGGSTGIENVIQRDVDSMATPLVEKFAKQMGIKADEAKVMVRDAINYGGDPGRVAKETYYPAAMAGAAGKADPAVANVAKVMSNLGLEDTAMLKKIARHVEDIRDTGYKAMKARNIAPGRNVNDLPKIVSEQVTKDVQAAKTQPFTSPLVSGKFYKITDPEALRALKADSKLATHWRSADELMVLTSNGADVRRMEQYAEAGKATQLGERGISATQANAWRAEGGPMGGLFQKDFRGEHFAPDIGKAAGKWGKIATQHIAAADMRDMIKESAVRLSDEIHAASPELRHLIPAEEVMKKMAGSPLIQLIGDDLKGLKLPQPMADMLLRAGRLTAEPEAVSRIMRIANLGLRVWKPFALGHPAYMLRNIVQNYMGMAYQGINPAAATKKMFEIRNLVQAVNSGKDISRITINIAGRAIPAEKIIQQARLYNMMNSGFTSMVMNPGMYGKIKDSMPALGKWWFAVNNNIETTMRMSAWLTCVEQGMDFRQAALKTITAMPDLTDLTTFEQKMRNVFPWFSWMRKNTENVARLAIEKPSILPGTEHLRQAIQTSLVGENKIEEGLRPDWMQQQQAMQISGNDKMGNVWLLASWLPFNDLMNILEGTQSPGEFVRGVLGQVRPDVKVFAEMATGSDIFRNKPIMPFTTQELFTTMMVPKALIGRSGTALDNLLALRAPREIGRIAMDMPTVGGAIGRAIIGGAIQPLTRKRALFERMQQLNEQGKKLRNAIKKAEAVGDKSAIPGLAKQWARTQAEMYRLGMPGVAKTTQKSLAGAGVTAGEPAFAQR